MSKVIPINIRNLEFHEIITPDGEVYLLNTNSSRFVYNISGEGLPPYRINSQKSPYQDGGTPLNATLGSRMITMTLHRRGDDFFEYYEIREELIDIFRLNRQTTYNAFVPSTLRRKLPNGDIRDLKTYLDKNFMFARSSDEWDEFDVIEVARFYCPNPIYYDPSAHRNALAFEEITDLLFPVAGPIEFGGGESETDTETYLGDYKTSPTFIITGPARNPKIKNLTTSQLLQINHIIPAGITMTITTTKNAFGVVDSNGVDLKGTVTDESDFDFILVPAPTAPGGVNSLALSASATGVGTAFTVEYFDRYQGF